MPRDRREYNKEWRNKNKEKVRKIRKKVIMIGGGTPPATQASPPL